MKGAYEGDNSLPDLSEKMKEQRRVILETASLVNGSDIIGNPKMLRLLAALRDSINRRFVTEREKLEIYAKENDTTGPFFDDMREVLKESETK
jgi:hypothetical protein